MISLGENLSTIGQLRHALKDIPDDALLNIGNQNYGFSVDEIHYDGISVALETKEKGVFETITDSKIEAAKQCLIDNGIDMDEAENVLQALGYILLNQELFPEEAKDISKTVEPEIGMTGTIACCNEAKKSFWGKSVTIVCLNDGFATCSIEGKPGTYAIPVPFMKNLSFPDKEPLKTPLTSQIQSASARKTESVASLDSFEQTR